MLLEKVKKTIILFNMLERGDRVLIGVSGGPDSMALLYILNTLKKEFDLELFVAHLNHMIRKGDAQKDACFVEKAAEKLNLAIATEARDVPKMASARKFSVEEAARAARYDFYLEAAARFNANKIALGHTQDDQAETVLMRLIRGSGLLGLGGIPPVRRLDGAMIIRPLIEISKDEIRQFLRLKKISFRTDTTNAQPIYLRNRLRQKLLPLLEKEFNPEIKKILSETGKNLRIDYEYFLKIAEKKFRKYAKCANGEVKINIKVLDEDTAVQRMVIRQAIKNVKGNLDAVSYKHWEGLNSLLGKKTGWSVNLPGMILAQRIKNELIFSKKGITISGNKKEYNLKNIARRLKVPGKTAITEVNKIIKADFVNRPSGFKFKKSKSVEYFDLAKLATPLFVMFKSAGDKIKPLGMDKYKRVKQLFIDEKVPVEKRGRIPLVFSGDKLIWVCGVKRSDYAKLTGKTGKVLQLRIE